MIYDETPKCEAAEIQSWFKCTGKYNFNIYLKTEAENVSVGG